MRRLDRRLGLHLVEGCRNRDDGAGYVDPAEFGLNLPQQRLDDLGARFLGRNALAGGGQIEMARSAHKALEALGNVSRSKLRLCMGPATYQHVTAPIKVDHAWQDIPPVISLEQAETLTVATDDSRVRSPKINPNVHYTPPAAATTRPTETIRDPATTAGSIVLSTITPACPSNSSALMATIGISAAIACPSKVAS